MRSTQYIWFLVACALTMISCAGLQNSNDGEAKVFTESAADVRNSAPLTMTPKLSTGAEEVTDPTYGRTQADYHYSLAESYSYEGQPEKAIEEFKLTLVFDAEATHVYLRLASEYVKVGLMTEAISSTEKAIALEPQLIEAQLLLGGLYTALKAYDKAMAQYRVILQQYPNHVDAQTYIGALYAEQQQTDQAIKQFNKVCQIKDNPKKHLCYYYTGRLYLEKTNRFNNTEAEKHLRLSLNEKPDFLDALFTLGQLLEQTKRVEEAENIYENYQEKYGPDATVADILGRMYLAKNRPEKAMGQFELVERDDPDNLNVKLKIALIQIELKQFDLAIRKLNQILEKAPNSDKIIFYLAAIYEELKDFDIAIGYFLQVPPASSYYSEAVLHGSYLLKLQGQSDKAIKIVEKAIENKNDDPQFYILYASYANEMEEYQKAEKILTAGIEKMPNNPQLHFYLGTVCDRLGETDKSIAEMKKVLALDENHVQALNYLAYTLAEHNRELDMAEDLARRALTHKPDDGYVLDTLGWVLYKKGQVSEAVKILESAHQRQSTEAIIAEHLGDAYLKSQFPDRAKKMYLKAAEQESDEKKAKVIMDKVKAIENRAIASESSDD